MATETADLSEREIEILRLVATGASNKEIAQTLVISPNTVKVHLRNVFSKISVVSRTEATLYAIEHGLVPAPGGMNVAAVENSATLPLGDAPPAARKRLTPRRGLALLLAGLAVLALVYAAGSAVAQRLSPVPTQAATSASPTNRWQARADLPLARAGLAGAIYENKIIAIGGETAQGVTGQVDAYDPQADRWESRAPKPLPVTDVQAVLIGEKIYVPGGRLAGGGLTAALEVYDPRQDRWESKSTLPVALCGYALAAVEGRLYLFGGWDGQKALAGVYEYDPLEDRWQDKTPMPTARAWAGAAAISGKVFVLGGYDGKRALDANEVYFPGRDAAGEQPWNRLDAIPGARYAMGLVTLVDRLFMVGGRVTGEDEAKSAGISNSLQYLPQTGEWQTFDLPPQPVGWGMAVLPWNNSLLVMGGRLSTGYIAKSQLYQAIYTFSIPIVQ